MNADGAAVIWLMRRYSMGLMDPTVPSPEVQLFRYFNEVAEASAAPTYRNGEHAPESDVTNRMKRSDVTRAVCEIRHHKKA